MSGRAGALAPAAHASDRPKSLSYLLNRVLDLEPFMQVAPRTKEQRLDGARRYSKGLRHVANRHLLPVVEDDGRSLTGWQRRHRLPQVSIALAGDQAAQHDRVGQWLWRGVERGPLTSRRPRLPVQPVLGQPHGDGGEPRVEGPVLVVLIEVRVGADERVLRHLVG